MPRVVCIVRVGDGAKLKVRIGEKKFLCRGSRSFLALHGASTGTPVTRCLVGIAPSR